MQDLMKELERLQALEQQGERAPMVGAYSRAEMQAMFRLGQKDMQQSILEMIRSLTSSASGITHITLTTLAEMIGGIEVKP